MPRNPSCRRCRLNTAGQWIGWHLLELTAVGVPLALALTVSTWWLGLAVLAGAVWIGHELHLSRGRTDSTARPEVTAGPQPAAVTAATESTQTTSESSQEASA